MKKTALIILNYNNAHDTRECIKSIQTYNSAPVKYIIVDNNSRTQELEKLKNELFALFPNGYKFFEQNESIPTVLPETVLIETGRNLGYARGNNVGLQMAFEDPEIDYVMILNNDILFVQDILPSLIKKHAALPNCAILSPVLYKKGMKEYDYNCARRNFPVEALIKRNFLHYWWQFKGKKNTEIFPDLLLLSQNTLPQGVIDIELPSGSCMLLKKDYFASLDFFDPRTFLFFEENILYQKIKAKGDRNYLSLEEKCIHLGASTMQAIPNSYFVMNESKKSELYYVNKYSKAPFHQKLLHRLSVYFFKLSFRLQKALMDK